MRTAEKSGESRARVGGNRPRSEPLMRIQLLFVVARRFALCVGSGLLALAGHAYAALSVDGVTYTYGTQINVATVYVQGSAAFTANVTVSGTTNWGSTSWRISTTAPGTSTCSNLPTPTLAGGSTRTSAISVTAPAAAGTYNGYFRASSAASGCGSTLSPWFNSPNSVIVDNTVPTIPTATIASNNADPIWAKTGDIVTLTFTVNDNNGLVRTPVVTIRGAAASVSGTYPNFTASRTMLGSDTEGVVTFTIDVMDLAGNAAAQRTTITSGSNVTFDRTIPTIPTATISSNNADPTYAIVGNIVTLSFTTSDANGVQTPVVTIAGSAAAVSGGPSSWTASRTMAAGDPEGTVTFTINASDPAGNPATQRTTITSGSNVTFRKSPTAATNAASGVTAYVATLNGTVGSGSYSTTVTFEYGLTPAYGNSIAATPSPIAGGAVNTAVTAALEGLACNTTFNYRVVATNSAGTAYGGNATFTTSACAAPFPVTMCAAERFGSDLGCSANDVNITSITLAAGSMSSCVSGTPVTLDLDLELNFASPDRWDIGIFIANDGKLPTLLPGNGGASSCSVAILPITLPPNGDAFLDLDGVPQGTADTCGDGNSAFVPLPPTPVGSGIKRMSGVTLPCYATAASGGDLFVPFVVSWDNQKSPIGGVCTSNQYPVPNTTSKCNAPASTVSIAVVVLPKINKTHSGSTFNPGDNITYTVTIFNDSGGTLKPMVFQDPAVTNLAVNSVGCAGAAGASCAGMTVTVGAMQGSGIAIPSANLPNNSTLTFTLDATISGSAKVGDTISNLARVSIGSSSNTSTDTIILGAPSASKSFAPSTITEGNTSVLTVTLNNPGASPVTGVSFTDTYPAGLVNSASANGATTCGGTVTAANNGNSVALSGGTIAASGSCTVTVNVTSATAANYINSTGTITTDSGNLAASSATLTVNPGVFGAFNACNVAAVPNPNCTNTTTATTSRITTKIAGSAFSLDLVALKTDGTRNTNYSNTVLVQLLDASNNTGALDAYNCRSTWTVITALSPNPAFTNPDNGLITVGSFNIAEAYRDVRVKVSNVGGATRIGCSTDNFAIRPNSLSLSVTDTDWATSGTSRTLNNTDPTSPGSPSSTPYPIHKAGQPFTIRATALNASSATTTYYTVAVNPSAVLTDCGAPVPCTATFGALALGAFSVASGVVTWNSASYSDVGAFNLELQDSDFASVDAVDTAASCAGRYVCGSTTVGRFVPNHFVVSGGAIVNRSDVNAGAGCAPASTFTYMGEPMKASFTLTAKNAAGNTTPGYDTGVGLAKFGNSTASWTADTGNDRVSLWMIGQNYAVSPGTCKVIFSNATPSVTSYDCTGVGNPASINRTAGPRVTISSSPAGPSISFASGAGSFVAHAVLQRADSVDGAYNTVNLGVAPVDADGVTVQPSALNLDANNDTTNERVSLGTTGSRFGVLKLDNAYGSELLSIRVPVRAMYWTGGANGTFATNTDDSCTQIAAGNIALGNYKGGLNGTNMDSSHLSGLPITLSGGTSVITLTKPTPTAVGSVDLAINLGATGSDANCIGAGLTATGADVPWLRGNWCPSGYDKDPNARLTFGTSRSPFIYLREMY